MKANVQNLRLNPAPGGGSITLKNQRLIVELTKGIAAQAPSQTRS